MNDTDKYEGQERTIEVVWLCEPDEKNWDGILGAGMYEPRLISIQSTMQWCTSRTSKYGVVLSSITTK